MAKIPDDKNMVYDPRTTRRIVKALTSSNTLTGTRSTLLKFYNWFTCGFMIFFLFWGLITAFLSFEAPAECFEILHSSLVVQICLMNYFNQIFRQNEVNKGLDFFTEIFPNFTTCQLTESQTKIKQNALKRIGIYTKIVRWSVMAICSGYTIFTPIKNWLLPQLRGRVSEKGVNSILPVPLYLPVDNFVTFHFAYFSISFALLFSYGQLTNIQEIICSVLIQTEAQVYLLNDSISNLENRALQKFKLDHDKNTKSLEEGYLTYYDLYKTSKFQECIFECITEDIRHHLAIVRCVKKLSPYLGILFLEYSIVSPFLWAIKGYFIIKRGIAMDKIIEFLLMTGGEFFFISQFCLLVENIITASSATFVVAYSLPWYHYNKKMSQVIHIFLTRCVKPISYRTSLFKINVNCELLLSMYGTAFSYINIIRTLT